MKIDIKTGSYSEEELLIFPISVKNLKELTGSDKIIKNVCRVRDSGDFKAKKDEAYCFLTDKTTNVKRVMLIGMGDAKSVDQELIRRAYSIAVKNAQKLKITDVATVVLSAPMPALQLIPAIVEGIELSNYVFQKYVTKEDKKITMITSVNIYCKDTNETGALKKIIKETQTVCKYVNIVRDFVNENSNEKYSLKFASAIKDVCAVNKLDVKEMGEKELEELGMKLILAVNSGSSYPPRVLEINYTGNKESSKKIALIGKGLTFDTGGLNLKPSKFIEDMKLDMAGAATVVSIINCAAALKLKQNITAVVPLVENMIGPKAFKPGDVFGSYSKKTVEITNTDAEGRLVLADTLSYTIKKYKPNLIVDIATLTGACLVALGEYYAGVMSNDQKMVDMLVKSSRNTSENIWQLPLYDDLAEGLKSDIADIKNSSSKRFGGSIIGGLFLKEFVDDDTPWIHIDFAGPAYFESGHYYMKKGGTGFGVRLMIDFLRNIGI